MAEPVLTERQKKYFASLRQGLARKTGRSLEAWAEIARACTLTSRGERLAWLREKHGLAQNRGTIVIAAAFGYDSLWGSPDALIDALWKDPASRATYEAVDQIATALPGALRTARKGFTAWARSFQFAAARPAKGGKLILGLAVSPEGDPRLAPASNEGWSERLKSRLILATPADVDAPLAALLRQAWERS